MNPSDAQRAMDQLLVIIVAALIVMAAVRILSPALCVAWYFWSK